MHRTIVRQTTTADVPRVAYGTVQELTGGEV